MVHAREIIWENGQLPAAYEGLWNSARIVLHAWPGFQRMKIGKEEQEAIDQCYEELTELFNPGQGETLTIAETDDGMELTLSPKRRPNPKRWWQFWHGRPKAST